MSKLEQFIRNNRQEFDTFEPDSDLWKGIEQKLNEKEKKSIRLLWFQTHMMRYAAAAIIVFIMGYGVFQLGRYSAGGTPEGRVATANPNVTQISPELAQAEAYYTSLINEEKALLDPKEVEALGLKDDFNEDLVVLDSTYKNLKKELVTEPNKDRIIAAMVKNLQLRVEIIRQQIETLQRVNKNQRKEPKSLSI
ncbi:hypothetical protein QNI19_14755 [Cytophagaceae bacterium DM2B3-1]|uniref:Anti-sigma factor n=1 Tax=Xanthocytophaga flava TaxID=3048013 RepID=A0ABT7CKD2_9BACT|nr:hypothetical protein [Xanthocytophaga flavus]MDJ1494201.1 hypothetical protein [Xanthocytophaga flavus]